MLFNTDFARQTCIKNNQWALIFIQTSFHVIAHDYRFAENHASNRQMRFKSHNLFFCSIKTTRVKHTIRFIVFIMIRSRFLKYQVNSYKIIYILAWTNYLFAEILLTSLYYFIKFKFPVQEIPLKLYAKTHYCTLTCSLKSVFLQLSVAVI